MTYEGPENRRFTRILFDAPCELTQGDRRWQSRIVDVSLNGVLVVKPADWDGDAGNSFEVLIHLGDDSTTINMIGSLTHAEQGRLGFLCWSLSLDSATHLRRLIELNLGDEELLHRELHALITQSLDDE